jgi:hypothetical protein
MKNRRNHFVTEHCIKRIKPTTFQSNLNVIKTFFCFSRGMIGRLVDAGDVPEMCAGHENVSLRSSGFNRN